MKKRKLIWLSLSLSSLGVVGLPLMSASGCEKIIDDIIKPNPVPEPNPQPNPQPETPGDDNNSKPKPDDKKTRESSLWSDTLIHEPEMNFSKGYYADKYLGYVLNIGAMKINDRIISSNVAYNKLDEANNTIVKNYNEYYKTNFNCDLFSCELKENSKFNQKDMFSNYLYFENRLEKLGTDWFRSSDFERYITDLRFFSVSRIKDADKSYRKWTNNDFNALSEINSDYWMNYSLLANLLKRAHGSINTIQLMQEYIKTIKSLQKDLADNNQTIANQLSLKTKNQIQNFKSYVDYFLKKENNLFIEAGKEKWLFDVADYNANYDMSWKFNRLIQLYNEFLVPLLIASGLYSIEEPPFFDDIDFREETIWYPKYLFKKWDHANGIYISEIKKYENVDELNKAFESWNNKNIAFDFQFNKLI